MTGQSVNTYGSPGPWPGGGYRIAVKMETSIKLICQPFGHGHSASAPLRHSGTAAAAGWRTAGGGLWEDHNTNNNNNTTTKEHLKNLNNTSHNLLIKQFCLHRCAVMHSSDHSLDMYRCQSRYQLEFCAPRTQQLIGGQGAGATGVCSCTLTPDWIIAGEDYRKGPGL